MEKSEFKALVAGGGPAGLATACLLAQEGVDACLIAPESHGDLRTVALMQPALKLLAYIGVWPGHLQAMSAPLRQLHIVDDTGNYVSAPRLEFLASETGHDAFGWNIPVNALVAVLQQRLAQLSLPWIKRRAVSAQSNNENITIHSDAGECVSANVAIAADGRNSMLRQQAQIPMIEHPWNQKALVFSFSHSGPHEDTSTEYHKQNGLMTTVPLPGQRSSLVWMDLPDAIDQKTALSSTQLCAEVQLACHGDLGRISDRGPMQSFQMKSSRAETFAKNRVFLVGEAAHTMPPIGAQGLNLSFRDAGHACDTVLNFNDPGDASSCEAYHQLRQSDLLPRAAAVSLMNQSLLSGDGVLAALRSTGLSLVNAVPTLRRWVVEQGLAPSGDLPFAMRG